MFYELGSSTEGESTVMVTAAPGWTHRRGTCAGVGFDD
jgi:hypothetical protein